MSSKASLPLLIWILHATFFIFMNEQAAATNPCLTGDYQKTTLKLVKEQTIADSFFDLSAHNLHIAVRLVVSKCVFRYDEVEKSPNRFEASDIVLSRDGHVMYVVFDNTYQIGAICTALGRSFNCTDRLLDWPDSSLNRKKSGFEGMTYNPTNGNHFVIQESIETDVKKVFKANVFEIHINTKASSPIRIVESCMVNWEFGSENKGFEGLEFAFHRSSGNTYLLGLCEANKCDHKSASINDGRIVVLKKQKATTTKSCLWEPVSTFDLPSSVHFNDYSAISIYHQESYELPTYVAVTSQENSQLWIGLIEELDQAPFFDASSLHKTTVYDLPRATQAGSNCQVKYCNIEGVAWRGKNQLILVSDKAKSDQHIDCIEKDQSVHYLSLPENLTD
ncbi:unnamed protein product [Rotaria magnacalcarata]|uniref:Uncharacterized protein n=2 Tax=Rotaria magnacalcarata TaxID=392030 RepID=A0A819CHQ4_9BILA|nr:unnamed protein product [Rotaria magnacalcarata]